MSTKHGHAASNDGSRKASLTYVAWCSMKKRCLNSNSHRFHNYGGRGIGVCDRWLCFSSFLADMGECTQGMQLDRINNENGYEPNNCRWTTPAENSRNTRRTVLTRLKAGKILSMKGDGLTPSEIARNLCVSAAAVKGVFYGKTWREVSVEADTDQSTT